MARKDAQLAARRSRLAEPRTRNRRSRNQRRRMKSADNSFDKHRKCPFAPVGSTTESDRNVPHSCRLTGGSWIVALGPTASRACWTVPHVTRFDLRKSLARILPCPKGRAAQGPPFCRADLRPHHGRQYDLTATQMNEAIHEAE